METFFASHQYTFSAIGAIGSMLAVIVSLLYSYAAHSQNTKVRVRCTMKLRTIVTIQVNNLKTTDYYILLNIVNKSFFGVNINMKVMRCYGSTWEMNLSTHHNGRLERGQSNEIQLSYSVFAQFNAMLPKGKFFGKFGNKLYIELTDGTKIKIDNRIPKHVPNK